jgi:FkbM family methyltransferase
MGYAQHLARACLPRPVRNWLRAPGKTLAWAADELRYAVGAVRPVEMRPGWTVRCHPAAYRFSYHAQLADLDQVAEFDAFIAHCRPGMVFLDVGAHFGLFSLAALHFGGGDARALAVDPSPTACRMTRLQARLNGHGGRLPVLQAAVSDRPGTQYMVTEGVATGGYYSCRGHGYPASERTLTLAVSLDELVRVSGAVPTHVKIDVEGHEAAVLRGGRRLLSGGAAPLLFLELHNRMVREEGGDPSGTLELLKGFGYDSYTIDGSPLTEAKALGPPVVRILARKAGRGPGGPP